MQRWANLSWFDLSKIKELLCGCDKVFAPINDVKSGFRGNKSPPLSVKNPYAKLIFKRC